MIPLIDHTYGHLSSRAMRGTMPDEWATCLPTAVGLACVAAPLLVGGGGSLHGKDEGRDHYRIGDLVKDLRLHGICLCIAMGKIIFRVADDRSSCTGRDHGTRRLIAHLQEKVNPLPQHLLKSLVSAGKESDLVEQLSARNIARRKAAAAKRMRRSALAQMRASNIAENLGLLVASKRWGDVFAVGGREERAKLNDREEKKSNRLLNTCLPKRVEKVGRQRQRVLGLTLKLVGLSSGSLAKKIAGHETRIDEVKLELVRLRAERAERARRADEVRLALVRFWCPAALQLLGNNEFATRELLSGNEISTARLNGLGITDEVERFRCQQAIRNTVRAEAEECQICFDGEPNTMLFPCGHMFCSACAVRMVQASRAECPSCRTRIDNLRG